MLRAAVGIAVVVGVAFLAAVWWPGVEGEYVPPSRPEETLRTGTAGSPDAARPADPPAKAAPLPPPGETGGPVSLDGARAWEDMDQPGKALEHLDRILAREPENAEALYLRGRAHLKIGMPRLAERDFRAAVAREPTAERHEALADVIKMRDPDEAIENLRKALELDPERARAYALLARIQYRLGRIAEAREANDRALEKDPTDELALRMRDQLR